MIVSNNPIIELYYIINITNMVDDDDNVDDVGGIFTFSYETLPIAKRCRSFLFLTTHNSFQSLINSKSTFQEGIIIAIIYFSSVMFP